MGNQTFQSQFERRSRSNLPYSKKPGTTRSDASDIFGEATTAATQSPTFRHGHALSIGGGSERKGTRRTLQEVTEFPFPKNAITNDYRKTRLLKKGCPKLLRHVDKHLIDIEKSLFESTKLSQRLTSNIERIKLSTLTTRS